MLLIFYQIYRVCILIHITVLYDVLMVFVSYLSCLSTTY